MKLVIEIDDKDYDNMYNIIDNKSFVVTNPFNTYQFIRVIKVSDLLDLLKVTVDDEWN